MNEHPIIFSTDMVKAILEGRKTMTRRVVKLPKWMLSYSPNLDNAYADGNVFASGAYLKVPLTSGDMAGTVQRVFCPYGYPYNKEFGIEESRTKLAVGLSKINFRPMKPEDADRLWVKETFWHPQIYEDDKKDTSIVCYKANLEPHQAERQIWKPSIFMPRWASRILLEITEIRAERLQSITEEDVVAEGISRVMGDGGTPGHGSTWEGWGYQTRNPQLYYTAKYKGILCNCNTGLVPAICAYKELWDSLNAKRGYNWDKNPWVWRCEFKQKVATLQ